MNPDKLNDSLAQACVTLGLAPPFTLEQAKARYRELAKVYHPDVGSLKNGERFGEISRAYELLENNISRLTKAKIGFISADVSQSKVGTILEELHAARTQTLKAEHHARQMADEAEALRRFYSATKTTSKRAWIITTLCSVAALVAGIAIGVLKSSSSPIKYFDGSYQNEVELKIKSDPPEHNLPKFDATVSFPEGKVSVGASKAELLTSPTVHLKITWPPDPTDVNTTPTASHPTNQQLQS